MTTEADARMLIDKLLEKAGWDITIWEILFAGKKSDSVWPIGKVGIA